MLGSAVLCGVIYCNHCNAHMFFLVVESPFIDRGHSAVAYKCGPSSSYPWSCWSSRQRLNYTAFLSTVAFSYILCRSLLWITVKLTVCWYHILKFKLLSIHMTLLCLIGLAYWHFAWLERPTASVLDGVQRGQGPEPVERPRGPHVCSGASCYVWEKFSGRVQIYDGWQLFCKVTTKKRKKVARKIEGQLL